jgi:hypothetical protein
MATVPRAEYPRTAAVAAEMAEYGSDRHYQLVLEQYLAGVVILSAAKDLPRPP